jgi:hypothetical protein
MTRQRKTHLAILALVPMVVFTAVRCADSTGTTPATADTPHAAAQAGVAATMVKLHAANDWVGQFHNDALGYVRNALDGIPARARNRLTVCETARKAYREFHKARRGTDVPASVDGAFGQFCSNGSRARPASSVAMSGAGNTPRTDLSYDAEQFTDQFLGAIDASVSYDDLNARINSIDAAAVASLSTDDASAVVLVGAIALSSADYWANNIQEWDPFVFDDTGFFSVLTTARIASTPAGIGSGRADSWGSIWNDTKAAAKRAARGDISAAVKALVTMGVAGGAAAPIAFDIVLSASATGSIMSVLNF